MNRFLERLLPARLRARPELTPEERLQCWKAVTDQDLCLHAVHDLLGDLLESSADVAFSPDAPPHQAETARLRAGVARDLMRQIEFERQQAKLQK